MDDAILEMTAHIVMAHASANQVETNELPELIKIIYDTLAGLGGEEAKEETGPEPAVTKRKSLASRDHIISMIDGKPYRTLKRHLGIHGYTPETYRKEFNLPADYPMVARSYSEKRSAMAKEIGLGKGQQKRGRKKAP